MLSVVGSCGREFNSPRLHQLLYFLDTCITFSLYAHNSSYLYSSARRNRYRTCRTLPENRSSQKNKSKIRDLLSHSDRHAIGEPVRKNLNISPTPPSAFTGRSCINSLRALQSARAMKRELGSVEFWECTQASVSGCFVLDLYAGFENHDNHDRFGIRRINKLHGLRW